MVFERGIFGSDEIEKLFADGAGGFEAQTAKARQSLAPITEAAAAQAQALRDAVADFNQSLSNLETRAGPTFYRWMTKAVGELDAVLGKIERHPADAGALAGIGTGAAAARMLRRKIMAGSMLNGGGGDLRAATSQLSGAGAGLDKTAVTLNEAAIALREAAIELRGRGGLRQPARCRASRARPRWSRTRPRAFSAGAASRAWPPASPRGCSAP